MTWTHSLALFAQAKDAARGTDNGISQQNMILIGVALVAVLIFLVFLFIFFSFIRLWIQALLTKADIGIGSLIGMKLRNVDYAHDRPPEDRARAGRGEDQRPRNSSRTSSPAATCRRPRRR